MRIPRVCASFLVRFIEPSLDHPTHGVSEFYKMLLELA